MFWWQPIQKFRKKMIKRLDKILIINLFSFLSLTVLLLSNQTKAENKTSKVLEDKTPPPPWVDTTKTLKEPILLDYIVSAKTIKPNKQNGIPFNKLDYDKVIAYNFAGSEEPYPSVINEKGKFVPVVLGQQYLTQMQADKILSTFTSKATYGEATAACFQPHFALVLYKENKKISQINICLDCNYLISDIEIPAQTHKKVNAGTKDEYAITGFTKSGKKAIIKLCKELNFYLWTN